MENNYTIKLEDSNKITAIKVYCDITGSGLKEAIDVIDNTSGIIFDNLSLSEANNIAAKFQTHDCQVSVCISSMENFCDIYSDNKSQANVEVNTSTLSNKELLVVLKRSKNTILSAEQLQTEMEAAEQAVEKVLEERFEKETHCGPITFIGIAIGGLMGLLILSIIGLIIGLVIGFFVAYTIDSKINSEKNLAQAQKYYNENYPMVDDKRNKIKDMARVFFNSAAFAEAQKVIPSDYFDIESVDYIIKMVENRRADTLKEAINMYEDDLYKSRMEEMQRQQVMAAREAAEAQKQTAQAAQQQVAASLEIARYAKATARATRLNTFVNIIKK